jgi:hypothetical protein
MYSYMRRSVLAIGLVVALSTLSSAQYGGGGMGGTVTGTPGYNSNRSYGSKGAIIGAIAGAQPSPAACSIGSIIPGPSSSAAWQAMEIS